MLGEGDQEKKKELLIALVEEKLELREVAKAFQEEFIDRMSKLNLCTVYIHPNTELLKEGNLVASKKLKIVLINIRQEEFICLLKSSVAQS